VIPRLQCGGKDPKQQDELVFKTKPWKDQTRIRQDSTISRPGPARPGLSIEAVMWVSIVRYNMHTFVAMKNISEAPLPSLWLNPDKECPMSDGIIEQPTVQYFVKHPSFLLSHPQSSQVSSS